MFRYSFMSIIKEDFISGAKSRRDTTVERVG
jgi:hypothetical protein